MILVGKQVACSMSYSKLKLKKISNQFDLLLAADDSDLPEVKSNKLSAEK